MTRKALFVRTERTPFRSTLKIEVGARRAWQGERELQLTRLEFDVLEYVARRAGQVVKYEELWMCVWKGNENFGAAEQCTVREVLKRLRRKLKDGASICDGLTIVRGVGVRAAAECVEVIE